MRRRKLPVLAEISGAAPEGARAWSLRRADLEALGALLGKLRDSRVVLVSGEEEGKSVAAVGLAAAAGVAGKRAALLECDLAEPKLAGTLGLASAPGLHEYLRWEASAPQILQPAVLAGPESGNATAPLICVVAGEPTPDGATLLSSESFGHATMKLRRAYDMIVIDGPPVGRDEASLAAVAQQVDSTLACVGRSTASGRPAKALRATLRRLHLAAAGLIVVD